jgi:hypothetical protein
VLFERLAVNSGWYVRYHGFQYSGILHPVDPMTDTQDKRPGDATTADFLLCRDDTFAPKKVVRVEVKFRESGFLRRNEVDATKSDYVVIFADGRVLAQETKLFVNDKERAVDIEQIIGLGISSTAAAQVIGLYPRPW